MARLKVEGADVVVSLDLLEVAAAFRREVRAPVACLRMVHVEDSPLAGLSRLRFPGLWWPGTFLVGSGHRDGRREFVAVRSGRAAVVLDSEGARWDRIVVSLPDAVEVAADLAALLLGRRPGNPGPRRAFPASTD